jgi:hypothetical protein
MTFKKLIKKAICISLLVVIFMTTIAVSPALAAIDDDKFDGNIFALYAGNGSLVPPRISLAESLKQEKPAILFFFIDDSRDCKQYASTVSGLQSYYGRAASFIPVNVDSLPTSGKFTPQEEPYYYRDRLPQVVVIDGTGKVRLNETGQVPFERVDQTLREVFNLLPREESIDLKPRSFNEFNAELAK